VTDEDQSTDHHVGDGNDGTSLGTTAARGFLWANLGIVVRYGSGLVLAAVLARTLSPAAYAVMVTLMIVTFYFDNALDLGMGAALVYEQEKGISRRVQVAFTANVALAGILATVAFFGAPFIVDYFNLGGPSVAIFRCLAIVVLLSGLTTVPWALFTREMEFRTRSFVEVARDGTRLAVTIGLVVAGVTAWAVILGLIAAYAVWMVLTWVLVKFRPRPTWDRKIVGELWSYAWKLAGTRLLGILSLNGDYLVVGNRQSKPNYSLYYQAFRLPEVVMGGQLNAMSAVLFPMYSRVRAEGMDAVRNAMYAALRLVALFSIPVGVGLALVARDSMLLMYGRIVPQGVQTMELISLTGCVVGLGFATGDLLFALGKPGIMIRLNAVMVPCMLVAMWFVAPKGIEWVALVHLVTAVVFTGIRQLIVNRIVTAPLLPVLGSLVPGVVVAVFVAAAALPVRLLTDASLVSLVAIVVAGAVGGALALAVYRPARAELSNLLAKIRG
jgi:PST family polysaccharide transporter